MVTRWYVAFSPTIGATFIASLYILVDVAFLAATPMKFGDLRLSSLRPLAAMMARKLSHDVCCFGRQHLFCGPRESPTGFHFGNILFMFQCSANGIMTVMTITGCVLWVDLLLTLAMDTFAYLLKTAVYSRTGARVPMFKLLHRVMT